MDIEYYENFRFNYIITIHNKESLIEKVLRSVISCCRENSYIYPVLDDRADHTESMIDGLLKIGNVNLILFL